MIVNVVSQIPSRIWERELPEGLIQKYVHTPEPVDADIHVVYGLRSSLKIPNAWNRVVFVAAEPPEIRKYNLQVLARYRLVLAPSFSYLRGLPNYSEISAVAPWWVGTGAGGTDHYDEKKIGVSLTRGDFARPMVPKRDLLSVIVSTKARTPLQEQRLRLVDYLENKLGNIEVWGESRRFAEDKADVLKSSRYHLAVENSQHPGYWTEKLSDPLLMANYVFYQGDPHVGKIFDEDAIAVIDSYDVDGSYRVISERMASGAWGLSSEAREKNLRILLERESFHRVIDRVVSEMRHDAQKARKTVVPAQHSKPLWKTVIDPMYRLTRRLLK